MIAICIKHFNKDLTEINVFLLVATPLCPRNPSSAERGRERCLPVLDTVHTFPNFFPFIVKKTYFSVKHLTNFINNKKKNIN